MSAQGEGAEASSRYLIDSEGQTITTTTGEGTAMKFSIGQQVWVEGWPKSKQARYEIKKIRSDGTVDIWREHRGYGAMRTVSVERLGRRRQPVTAGR
jgi:hypothetical protein